MNAKLKSGLQVLGWGALASFAVVIYNNTPIDLGGPFGASVTNKTNDSEGDSIVIEGAKIQKSLSESGITVAVQNPHGQHASEPIVVKYNPDGGNHIVTISADSPGYLLNKFVDNCPEKFPIPKVTQDEGLAGILIAQGQDASEAEKLQASLMASDTEHGLAYRDSVISGKYLIPAIAKANLSVQFESSRDYIVHQYRFSCSDGKGNEGSKITNYFVVAPKFLARHR
jgi:hypothetical protein